eukprot:102855-Amphidinium_carterae.1
MGIAPDLTSITHHEQQEPASGQVQPEVVPLAVVPNPVIGLAISKPTQYKNTYTSTEYLCSQSK